MQGGRRGLVAEQAPHPSGLASAPGLRARDEHVVVGSQAAPSRNGGDRPKKRIVCPAATAARRPRHGGGVSNFLAERSHACPSMTSSGPGKTTTFGAA